jgi:hypothetical protein
LIERIEIDPFRFGMGTVANRSKDHGGNAGRMVQRRIHPTERACKNPVVASDGAGRAPESRDDRCIFRNLEGVAHDTESKIGSERRVIVAAPRDDGVELGFDSLGRFTRDRAPFDLQQAPIGVGRELDTAQVQAPLNL